MNKQASYILGIDTGGTFTDSVILDAETKEVICFSKALTTKDDLKVGIQKSINGLDFHDFQKIAFVSLSTTLATNAIVEGKGCKTGLILIGKKPSDPLPADECRLVKGKVDIKGMIIENIDQKEIMDTAAYLKGKVESIAISCYASVRNPKLELAVKKLLAEAMDTPLFCAHQLSGSLGFLERTVTSVLNARLVKTICDFIHSTESVLLEKHIHAPLMVVKGDGSLMHASMAMERPIETILSGPAASTIGACHLSGLDDALIIDMGGTTSDMANIHNGTADIRPEGALVGGWLTKVKAVNVRAYGLGGDSLVEYSDWKGITIGPEKVEPLCVTASICANVTEELDMLQKSNAPMPIFLYRRGKISSDLALNESEQPLLEMKKDRAFRESTIADLLHEEKDALHLEHLVKTGVLIRCSVTPTDLLHAMGKYTAFNAEASQKALTLLAAAAGVQRENFLKLAAEQLTKQLYFFCLQSAAAFEGHDFDFYCDDASMYLMEKAFSKDPDDFMLADFTLNKPIVGVGAPIHAWMPEVAKKLHTPLLIPQYAEVANAIGAALGKIMESASAIIRPAKNEEDFILYLPDETLTFQDPDKAVQHGKSQLSKQVSACVSRSGGEKIQITVGVTPVYTRALNSKKKHYVETKIHAFAVALPGVLG